MADLITIKSGALGERNTMPKLNVDELGYRTDEKALYIGTEDKDERLCGVNDVIKIDECMSRLSAIETKISEMDELIASIIARLEVLETPSE